MEITVARRGGSPLEWLGRNAHSPHVAAAAVAATAVAFSAAWFGVLVGLEPGEPTGPLFVATVANAYVVTWFVWRRYVPVGVWSYPRGLLLGGQVGVGSHATIGYVWLLVSIPTGEYEPQGALEFLSAGALYGAYSVVFTWGVPFALSVGVALALTHARRRVRTPQVATRK